MEFFADDGVAKHGEKGVRDDEAYWMTKFIEKVGEEKATSYLSEFEKLKSAPKEIREVLHLLLI
jgi:hypothetical protein